MRNEIIIKIKNLSDRFPNGAMGVDNISLCIHKGEFVILAGSNGSGKTTLLRHLNGLVMPSQGDVKIRGVRVKGNVMHARRMVKKNRYNQICQVSSEHFTLHDT